RGAETVEPCTEAIAERPAPFVVWIEDGASISFPVASECLKNGELLLLFPAATVELAGDAEVSTTFELVRLPDSRGGLIRRRIDRKRGHRVRIPEGRVAAFAYGWRGNAVAVARPVRANGGSATEIRLVKADRDSDLVAIVAWPEDEPNPVVDPRLTLN